MHTGVHTDICTHRQTDSIHTYILRQTYAQTDVCTDRQTAYMHTYTQTDVHNTYTQGTHIHMDGHTVKHTHTGIYTDIHTDRQTDRHTYSSRQ